MTSWNGVLTTLVFTAAQALAFYLLFELWRFQDGKKSVFQPRQEARPHRTPAEPPKGWFSWICAVGKVDDEETLRCVGMDTYVMLRFLRFCKNITFLPGVIAVVMLIPLYATGESKEIDSTGFNMLTLANVLPGSHRLWGSLGFMYVFVGTCLVLLWREWESFVPLRARYFAEGDLDSDPEFVYAAIVEDIPPDRRSSAKLYQYFDTIFPGKVSYASLCLATDSLDNLIAQRQKALECVEKTVAAKAAKPDKKEPTIRVGGKGCCMGNVVPKEQHCRSELERLNVEVEEEYGKIVTKAESLPPSEAGGVLGAGLSSVSSLINDAPLGSSSGFVTFTSSGTKIAATQLNLSGRFKYMQAFPAPAPADVIWKNAAVSREFSDKKRCIANAIWAVGILLWAIPVTFVQLIANLDSIAETAEWLILPDKNSVAYGLLASYLPVIALIVLMIILPIVIEAVAVHVIRMKSRSEVDLYVFKWHFGYQVANLWLIVIGGSLLDQLDPIINDPTSVVELVALSLPGVSEFFLNNMIAGLLGGMFMELSGLVPVIVAMIMGKISNDAAKTNRDIRTAKKPQPIKWGTFYPPLIFHMLVVMAYASITPIILAFAFVLFSITYAIMKNQSLYVLAQDVEGGGKIMYLLFKMIMACLYVGEVIFIVYMGIKEGPIQAPLGFVLLGFTILFHLMVGAKYVNPSQTMSMEGAAKLDSRAASGADNVKPAPTANTMEAFPYDGKAYVQPSMKKSTWETEPEPYRGKVNEVSARLTASTASDPAIV